jgi:hypothetical protein
MTFAQAPWPDTFQRLFPGAAPWVENLKTTDAAITIQGLFAQIEVFHIIGLFMLGGATILTSLRLIGVGLTEVPTSTVEKQTRLWFTIGVIMAIGSGLLIGLSNAEKLYNNTAFLFKMIAMVAGILFTYLVVIPTAQKEGAVGGGAKIAMIVALVLWLIALFIFAFGQGLNNLGNVGIFHLITAGALIAFMAIQGKLRWVFGIGLAAIILVWQVTTHFIVPVPDGMDLDVLIAYEGINRVFVYLTGLWVFALVALNIYGRGAPQSSTAMARLVGYSAILIWVTVGAGGRWIGLS